MRALGLIMLLIGVEAIVWGWILQFNPILDQVSVEDLVISPAPLVFDDMKRGEKRTGYVRLLNAGGRSISL